MRVKQSSKLKNYILYAGYSASVLLLPQLGHAVEIGGESYSGSVDTTVTYGISSRLDERDKRIIAIASGGLANSVNGDNGNLNFDKGIVSNNIKLTSEIEMNFDGYGIFARANAFYDREIMDGDREYIDFGNDAEDLIGSNINLLDAYVWSEFGAAENPVSVRFGNQVLSWGESTFIQNGINIINPVDASRIRVPGAELREALLPVPILSGSIGVGENGGFEAFYQVDWEKTEIDPPGSYFSTNDFVGAGGRKAMLGFGSIPDSGYGFGALTPAINLDLGAGPSGVVMPLFSPDFLGVPHGDDRKPEDSGQFGLAYRLFMPELNDTELGFYVVNYHSRVPIISAETGSAAGVTSAIQAFDSIMAGANTPGALKPTAATLVAVDTYAKTANYILEYPEDITMFGVSFNTQLGLTGIAFQGEVSHRQDVPLQVDDVELLFASLTPLAGSSGTVPDFGNNWTDNQLSTLLGPFGTETYIPGFILRDMSQVQFTGTRVFSNILGASQMAVVAELGYTHVHDMPSKDDLRLESAGTYTSGNPNQSSAAGDIWTFGGGHSGKDAEPASAFADANSWGYRLLAKFTYDNAIGSVNLTPQIAYAHDVSGNTPGPGGNFLEGRRAMTLGLGADYLNQWSGDLSYTRFDGAGRYNLINDRDFVAFNLKYAF